MLTIRDDEAPRIWDWIKNRNGVAVWRSVSLTTPGRDLLTPCTTEGKPTPRPHWSVESCPKVIADATAVDVTISQEVKRFHIAIRNTGLYLKLTDASSARVRRAVEAAGEGAYYLFDYETQEVIIFRENRRVNLLDYAIERGF